MDISSPDSVCATFAERLEKLTIRTLEEGGGFSSRAMLLL